MSRFFIISFEASSEKSKQFCRRKSNHLLLFGQEAAPPNTINLAVTFFAVDRGL